MAWYGVHASHALFPPIKQQASSNACWVGCSCLGYRVARRRCFCCRTIRRSPAIGQTSIHLLEAVREKDTVDFAVGWRGVHRADSRSFYFLVPRADVLRVASYVILQTNFKEPFVTETLICNVRALIHIQVNLFFS